jgi:hypothetical protein
MLSMRFFPTFGGSAVGPEENDPSSSGQGDISSETLLPEESHLLKTVGLVSAALGAVAIGLIVGREIRQRYKFNRRTPYDLYAHSGDELHDADCGVGI